MVETAVDGIEGSQMGLRVSLQEGRAVGTSTLHDWSAQSGNGSAII